MTRSSVLEVLERDYVRAAHAKGLKVILDYAMNHVHKSASVYAQHQDWFWPLNDGSVQNCVCGNSGCEWDGPNAKRCWFTDYLPDLLRLIRQKAALLEAAVP